MSWQNPKTGRPKEQGGHRRIDISVDDPTYHILSITNNKSKYVEYCVKKCTETKWIAFHESNVAVGDDYSMFKTAAINVWIPDDPVHNGIVSAICTFEHQCICKTFKFRMQINKDVTSSTELLGAETWSLSEVFVESSFDDEIQVQPNQESYIIEFQIEPFGISDRVYVRNITMFLEVVDGLPVT